MPMLKEEVASVAKKLRGSPAPEMACAGNRMSLSEDDLVSTPAPQQPHVVLWAGSDALRFGCCFRIKLVI